MRILFSLDRYGRPSGGADRLARGVVAALLAAGHEVRVIEPGDGAPGPQAEARFSHLRFPLGRARVRDGDWRTLRDHARWQPVVRDQIRDFRPDRVLTQNRLAPPSIAAARAAGVPGVILFHGWRCLSPTFFDREDALTAPPASFLSVPWRFRLKWPLVRAALDLNAWAYRHASSVIANSAYAAAALRRFFHCEAGVLHPILDLDAPATGGETTDGSVLFVKPQAIKGADLVAAIARLLPARRFVVAGEARGPAGRALAALPNVSLHGWVSDMPALYAAAGVILGPSRIPEPFGRVFVEAARHCVPAVASRVGGIPEAVGEGGVLLPPDAPAAEWAAALESALQPSRRAELGALARSHAETLLREHDGRRLLSLLGAGAG